MRQGPDDDAGDRVLVPVAQRRTLGTLVKHLWPDLDSLSERVCNVLDYAGLPRARPDRGPACCEAVDEEDQDQDTTVGGG